MWRHQLGARRTAEHVGELPLHHVSQGTRCRIRDVCSGLRPRAFAGSSARRKSYGISHPRSETADSAAAVALSSPPLPVTLRSCPPATLTNDIDRPLDCHIFVASKASWHEISDDAPQFDAYPPEYDTPGIDFEERTAATDGAVGGSCLCGAVRYEYDPPADRMIQCHCSRCRKSRGAAHSVQVFVPAERFRWLQGEHNRTAYKVPGARVFAPSFCNDCGSVTPRVVAGGPAIIPAGLLDDDPLIRPQLHIFVGSKAPWFSITDSLPRYDEMPPPPGD